MTKESLDANRLAIMIKRDMSFATMHGDRQVLHYEGGVYLPDGNDIIGAELEHRLNGDKVTTYLVNEVVNHIKRRTYVHRDDFDADPDIINMDNGLYSMYAGLTPHTPKYLSLHKSPIKYDPEAKCPLIDKFIEDVVPKQHRHTIYEIGGYAMAANKNLKRAFIFVGEPNSGKSVMISLLWQLIGKTATTDVSPLTVGNTTYGAAEYYGKQLNLVDDLGDAPITNTGILKSVIGGGRINAQFKYGQPFDYEPSVLCIFATNKVPSIEPFDDAFATRFSIIEFPNQFEGVDADPNLIKKLTTPSEMSGFFNKCMDAYIDLVERQAFNNDDTLADRVKAYKYRSSPVEQFIDEICDLTDNEAYITRVTLFKAYTKWLKERGLPRGHKKDLTMALSERGCGETRPMGDDNIRHRAYEGVDFKHDLMDYV